MEKNYQKTTDNSGNSKVRQGFSGLTDLDEGSGSFGLPLDSRYVADPLPVHVQGVDLVATSSEVRFSTGSF